MKSTIGWNSALRGIPGGWAVGGLNYYGCRMITRQENPPTGLLRRPTTTRWSEFGCNLLVLDMPRNWLLVVTSLDVCSYVPYNASWNGMLRHSLDLRFIVLKCGIFSGLVILVVIRVLRSLLNRMTCGWRLGPILLTWSWTVLTIVARSLMFLAAPPSVSVSGIQVHRGMMTV